jgi:hypothetical protein
MFRRQPDGIEIYFSWPSKTARVVPNQSVKSQIRLRDASGLTLVGVMTLIETLYKVRSIPLGVLFLVAFVAWFVERRRFLSTLRVVPLHVTTAQVDRAWIQDVGIYGGVMLTAIGALGTLGMAWATFAANDESRVPLFLSVPLILCALAMLYAGIRVLWAKLAR